MSWTNKMAPRVLVTITEGEFIMERRWFRIGPITDAYQVIAAGDFVPFGSEIAAPLLSRTQKNNHPWVVAPLTLDRTGARLFASGGPLQYMWPENASPPIEKFPIATSAGVMWVSTGGYIVITIAREGPAVILAGVGSEPAMPPALTLKEYREQYVDEPGQPFMRREGSPARPLPWFGQGPKTPPWSPLGLALPTGKPTEGSQAGPKFEQSSNSPTQRGTGGD